MQQERLAAQRTRSLTPPREGATVYTQVKKTITTKDLSLVGCVMDSCPNAPPEICGALA
ncbi:hypothetical protein NIES4103_17310 [Nostoc sp. NIES-4103]|nr:hypothetical protein NIES4103_17310 [Nostoc sp. NIES-4103]